MFRDVPLENVWHLLKECPTLRLEPEEELIRAGDEHRNDPVATLAVRLTLR
jgi:hypothetical protein